MLDKTEKEEWEFLIIRDHSAFTCCTETLFYERFTCYAAKMWTSMRTKSGSEGVFSRVMFSILKLDSLCKGWHKNFASNSRPQPTSGVVHIFPAVLLLMEKQECCAIVYRAIRRLRHNQHILGSSSRNYMSWKETGNNIYWGLVHQINIDCISIFIEMT